MKICPCPSCDGVEEGVKALLHSFWSSVLVGCGWWKSHHGRFIPGRENISK